MERCRQLSLTTHPAKGMAVPPCVASAAKQPWLMHTAPCDPPPSPSLVWHGCLALGWPACAALHCRQYEDYIAGVEVYSEFVDEKSNHQRVVYKFTPHQFRGINRIDIKGAALMPPSVMEGIIAECTPDNPYMVDIALMDKVRNKVEKW